MDIYETIDALRARLYTDGDNSVRGELEVLISKLYRVHTAVVRRDVLLGLSGPVEDWIRNNPEDFADDCENYYTAPDSWTARECAEWLEERGIDIDADDFEMNVAWGIVVDDDECREGLQDLVRNNAEPVEVFGWWAVSAWLAEWLRDNGYVMLNWYGIDVWGRETMGQAISMDAAIADFAREKDLIAHVAYASLHRW